MASQCHSSRQKPRESSRAVERGQDFRMVHFPDRPLKRISYRDVPREADCRRILLGWKTGKAKPPGVRSRRISRNVEKASESMSLLRLELERVEYQDNHENQSLSRDIREGPKLNPSSSRMADHGFTYRSLPESQYTSQHAPPSRTIHNSQSRLKAAQPLPKESHSSTQPPATYRRPPTQSSTIFPRSPTIPPSTCPLCRSHSKDDQGGLCITCKAEFTMSFSDFCEDDESILQSSTCFPHVKPLAAKAGWDYSSSVYSLDTSSIDSSEFSASPVLLGDADDPTLPVPPCSIIGDKRAVVPDTSIPASHPNQNGGAVAEKEQPDLYDLDWTEYYFDESNFASRNNARQRSQL